MPVPSWLLIVVTEAHGPQPFALLWSRAACALAIEMIETFGAIAECVPFVPGVAS